MFLLCSHVHMEHLSPAATSAAIKSAPAFARLGLSVRDIGLRERAIAERLEESPQSHDENQMTLPL